MGGASEVMMVLVLRVAGLPACYRVAGVLSVSGLEIAYPPAAR